MPQHRHGQRGVIGLMRSGQRGQRQGQFAKTVAVVDRFADLGRPIEITDIGPRSCDHRLFDHRLGNVSRIGLRYQRHTGAGDPGLFEGNPAQRITGDALFRDQQEFLVIDPQGGDGAGGLPVEHIGRIQSPAEANLDNAGIRRNPVEGEEIGSGGDFEKAGGEVLALIQHFLQQGGQQFVLDQLAGDANTLVIADQMRLRGGVDGQPFGFQHSAQIGAGAAFAIGARDMKHWRQGALRIAEPGQQLVHHLKLEPPCRQA